jgi:5-formyltetrahydrofolate cyclo-ligase
MPAAERAAAADALAERLLDLPELRSAVTVATYLSLGTEPATPELLMRLSERGTRLMAPLLLPNLDLDWAEPTRGAEPLGVDAVREADVVIAPALAVDLRGTRLGRGGGSYDRALARVAAGTPVIVLLYDGEVLPDVPAEAHDRSISIAVTPSRTWRFS